jgi:ABC-2 type transport system ATP-binding protein
LLPFGKYPNEKGWNMSLAIHLKNISKEYPGIKALDGIDLKVKSGTIHGFLGPNGAGKSTAMNIIAGLVPPSSGEVFIEEQLCSRDDSIAKTRIGLLPEHPPLYLNMRVEDYLLFCQEINGARNKEDREMVIKRCGLDSVRGRLIGNLSKGFRQRVGIAQALVFGAKIIILDEPTVGLDPNAIAEVRELIIELKDDHTILLSTHQLHEVARICDEVTIINGGKIIKTGSLLEVQNEFSSFRLYEACLAYLDENIKKSLLEFPYVQGLDVLHQQHGEYTVVIKVDGDEDKRSELTKNLGATGHLLSFLEKKVELEEVFKKAVK